MILRVQQNRHGGFTLVELIISAALMAIVLGSAYMCLSAGMKGQQLIDARGEGVQSARTALNMIAADLRAAIPIAGGKLDFLGMRRTVEGIDADNLDFSTRNYEPKREREPDYCEVSYFLTKDRESDSFLLIRRRDPTPDPEPLEGGAQQEIARGVRGLRVEYYDGYEWFDEWGDPEGKTKGMTFPPSNSYGLPEAVRITIVFDPETKRARSDSVVRAKEKSVDEKAPMTFQTIARIELAGLYNRQAASQSGASGNNNGAQQQQQQPGAAGGVPQ